MSLIRCVDDVSWIWYVDLIRIYFDICLQDSGGDICILVEVAHMTEWFKLARKRIIVKCGSGRIIIIGLNKFDSVHASINWLTCILIEYSCACHNDTFKTFGGHWPEIVIFQGTILFKPHKWVTHYNVAWDMTSKMQCIKLQLISYIWAYTYAVWTQKNRLFEFPRYVFRLRNKNIYLSVPSLLSGCYHHC